MVSSFRSSGPSGAAFPARIQGASRRYESPARPTLPTRHREVLLRRLASLTGTPETRMKPKRAIMPVPPVRLPPSCRRGLLVLTCLGALFLPACGKSARQPVHPVRGQVLVEGRPAAQAIVTFHPPGTNAREFRPSAQTDEQGNFTLTTYETGDGAPEGKYAVTVTWFRSSSNKPAEGDESMRNSLPPRYANPASSRLEATVSA